MEGITSSLFHSEQITVGYVTLEEGIDLPEHSHVHEQWTHVITGELLFNLNGKQQLLTPGMAVLVPSNTPHSAKALTICNVIDCFMPLREDFVELEKQI